MCIVFWMCRYIYFASIVGIFGALLQVRFQPLIFLFRWMILTAYVPYLNGTWYCVQANKELFDEMMTSGTLVKTDVPGIYHVQKLTELPFQIVIGNELEGDEHAEFRLLTDHAKEEDAKIVAEKLEKSTDSKEQEDGKRLFEFIEYRNPGITRTVLNELKKAEGGHEKLASILMNVLQPEIDVVVKDAVDTAVTTAVDNTTRTIYFTLVQDGDLTIERAAQKTGISVDQFQTQMNEYVKSHNRVKQKGQLP